MLLLFLVDAMSSMTDFVCHVLLFSFRKKKKIFWHTMQRWSTASGTSSWNFLADGITEMAKAFADMVSWLEEASVKPQVLLEGISIGN